MSRPLVERWEDQTGAWRGPSYPRQVLNYKDVDHGDLSCGGLNCSVDVVDWDGDGGRDLIVGNWDACFGGGVRLFEQTGLAPDGTPQLAPGRRILGAVGYVTVVPDNGTFHLLATSRLRRELLLFENRGTDTPRFGEPSVLTLDADWLCAGELLHSARFVDIDGDGQLELVVGTDYLEAFWPDGKEWFEEGYEPYTTDRVWRGGPILGHIYVFRMSGSPSAPRLARGTPLMVDGKPFEIDGGMTQMTFGDLRGSGRLDLVVGVRSDRLYVFPGAGEGTFEAGKALCDPQGDELVLHHWMHAPAAVDWDGDGRVDLVVTAENGFATFIRNTGVPAGGIPRFEDRGRIGIARPEIHAGVFTIATAGDFSGRGVPDVVAGNSSGELLFYPNAGTAGAPAFGRETRLRSGGEEVRTIAGPTGSIQGPYERKYGYTSPLAVDWDQDGRLDILTTDIAGRHLFLRNLGGYPPDFAEAQELMHEGRPFRGVWRVRPAVVDWLGTGMLTYICLDENGVLADYRKLSDTEIGGKRTLCFLDGEPIRFTEDFGGGLGRIKLCACDWTGDGRFDLLVGTHCRAAIPPGPGGVPRHGTGQAGVFLLENLGTNEEPRFGMPRPFRFQGEELAFGMHSCSADAVDWDGSGRLDLLVGVENGSLMWFRRDELSW